MKRFVIALGTTVLVFCSLAASAADFGYSTQIDIYLDLQPTPNIEHPPSLGGNDIRFDWTSAINRPSDPGSDTCSHRRDFVFNCGFYEADDTVGPGGGSDRYVCSAGNNAYRHSSYPKNPGHDPFAITEEGWFTFRHTFRDDGTGVLAVDLEILDSDGVLLKSWTLSNPTDLIDVEVGGNRYGWFVQNEFEVLAFDASYRDSCLSTEFAQGFEVDTAGWDVFGGTCDAVRVPSGAAGITSSEGSWHAEANLGCHGATDFGGYNCGFGGGTAIIDLRPGTDKNHINTNARQLVPLAFYGAECLSPCDEIDPATIEMRGATPSISKTACEDLDGDGTLDLIVYFRARELPPPNQEECDDPDATVTVSAYTYTGTPIGGVDDVTWLGPHCE